MYCIFCPNIISWRKVYTHELQLLYGNVPTRGAERWFFLTLRLDNCFCKSKRWLAWWQILQLDLKLKLGMNLVAAHYATSFRTVHTRVLLYLEFKVLIGYWSLFPAILAIPRTYPPLVEEAGLLSTSLYQRKQRCCHSLCSSLHL